MLNIFLNILAFSALLSSLLVITAKNPVIAVIFLISVFVSAAGYLMLLGVGFVGITYIIVYVGAITVLFLFVIMMINIKLTDILETGSQYTKNLPLAFAIGLLFIYELFTILPFSLNNVSYISTLLDSFTILSEILLSSNTEATYNLANVITAYNLITPDIHFTQFLQIQAIGQGIYTYGAMWLFICSIILLLAMVAPIFISRQTTNLNQPKDKN